MGTRSQSAFLIVLTLSISLQDKDLLRLVRFGPCGPWIVPSAFPLRLPR